MRDIYGKLVWGERVVSARGMISAGSVISGSRVWNELGYR